MDESRKIDPHIIKKYANVLIDEEILARIELLRKHSDAYRSILKHLNDLTNNMTSGVKFQIKEARKIYQLATGEITWNKLNEQEKRLIARNPNLMKAIDLKNNDIVPLIAVSRLIDYIKKGKITFDESYYFQDIGERLRNVELNL